MSNNIYIRLLNEGVQVYRPVPASRITSNIYVVEGADIYDLNDEEWEFRPGQRVVVEEQVLHGDTVLVATAIA